MKCKHCPACGEKSTPEEMICRTCLTALDNVDITECDEKKDSQSLQLSLGDKTILLNSDDVIGREAKGEDLLSDLLTVSREHARFKKKDGQWFVTDLGSTNGTYLNGEKIESSKEILLHHGDELGFSRKITFKVLL